MPRRRHARILTPGSGNVSTHGATAAEMLREMGMAFWLPEGERGWRGWITRDRDRHGTVRRDAAPGSDASGDAILARRAPLHRVAASEPAVAPDQDYGSEPRPA